MVAALSVPGCFNYRESKAYELQRAGLHHSAPAVLDAIAVFAASCLPAPASTHLPESWCQKIRSGNGIICINSHETPALYRLAQSDVVFSRLSARNKEQRIPKVEERDQIRFEIRVVKELFNKLSAAGEVDKETAPLAWLIVSYIAKPRAKQRRVI